MWLRFRKSCFFALKHLFPLPQTKLEMSQDVLENTQVAVAKHTAGDFSPTSIKSIWFLLPQSWLETVWSSLKKISSGFTLHALSNNSHQFVSPVVQLQHHPPPHMACVVETLRTWCKWLRLLQQNFLTASFYPADWDSQSAVCHLWFAGT